MMPRMFGMLLVVASMVAPAFATQRVVVRSGLLRQRVVVSQPVQRVQVQKVQQVVVQPYVQQVQQVQVQKVQAVVVPQVQAIQVYQPVQAIQVQAVHSCNDFFQ